MNPPGWVQYTKHSCCADELRGSVMAGVDAGLVMGVDVNSQPSGGSDKLSAPANWSNIWFGLAVVYLVGIYYGMITIRGE